MLILFKIHNDNDLNHNKPYGGRMRGKKDSEREEGKERKDTDG